MNLISRTIIFRFNSKTVTLRPRCYYYYVCSPSEKHKHGASTQSSINLGDTLLQITREWKTAETWLLARLLIYQSSIVCQTLDLIHWMVTIFSFDHMTAGWKPRNFGPPSRPITFLSFSPCSKLAYKWVCLRNFVIELANAPSTNQSQKI